MSGRSTSAPICNIPSLPRKMHLCYLLMSVDIGVNWLSILPDCGHACSFSSMEKSPRVRDFSIRNMMRCHFGWIGPALYQYPYAACAAMISLNRNPVFAAGRNQKINITLPRRLCTSPTQGPVGEREYRSFRGWISAIL